MKKILIFVSLFLSSFFFIIPAFSMYELTIFSPYTEYNLDTQTMKAKQGVSILYNGYELKGDYLYLDLKARNGEILSARYRSDDLVYCGDIYFSEKAFRILNGKVYKGEVLIFGAKKIALYPDEFLQASAITFYTKDGMPLFGIPYYGKLLFFKDHDIFPKVVISEDNISFENFVDYYNSSASFGFFALKWAQKEGFELGWGHYFSKTFGVSLDYKDKKIVYGLSFGGPVSLSIRSDFTLDVSYDLDPDSFIRKLSLRYIHSPYTLISDIHLGSSLHKVNLYANLSYILTSGSWETFKIGISPKISPFRLDLDYDFVKKEVGIWLHLDI